MFGAAVAAGLVISHILEHQADIEQFTEDYGSYVTEEYEEPLLVE